MCESFLAGISTCILETRTRYIWPLESLCLDPVLSCLASTENYLDAAGCEGGLGLSLPFLLLIDGSPV